MTYTKTSTVAAVALLAMAGTASAASFSFEQGNDQSLSAGESILLNTALSPTDNSASIDFTAEENLRLSRFAFTGNGFSGGNDLSNVTFGYTRAGETTSKFFTFTPEELAGLDDNDPVGQDDFLPGFELASGDMFSVFAEYLGGEDNVDVDVAFTTNAVDQPNPIPVPAAGGLLLGALGLGGFVARRKKTAA